MIWNSGNGDGKRDILNAGHSERSEEPLKPFQRAACSVMQEFDGLEGSSHAFGMTSSQVSVSIFSEFLCFC